ncbi:MAG: CPBP family intramembrane metalloprotease [Promethearchaeota archaeon]|nr:MAG: CPBP family intramembrane metalloprotease [Candidatus Lokiarchaeota archaeon]
MFRIKIEIMFKQFYENIVEPQQEKSWIFVIGSYLLDIAIIIFLMSLVYPKGWLSPIDYATEGIINTTLVASLLLFLIVIILLICVIGKEKPRNIGLKGSKIPVGIITFFGFYLLLNILLLIINVAAQQPLIWYPYWLYSSTPGLTWDVGDLLGQIFGNVLLEEVFFRGFIFIQMTKKFTKLMQNSTWGIINGAIVSNFLFSLLHIPTLIKQGFHGASMALTLLLLFGIGILLTSVYFITENLFVVMSVHVFYNISFALFYPIIPTYLLVIIFTIVGLIIWGILKYKFEKIRS